MQTQEKLIQLRNIAVSYVVTNRIFKKKRFFALKDVSLSLFQGETLGIIGKNGAGKSTLLKILAGLISPDKGEFINNGYKVSMLSLRVGFARHLSGKENAIISGMLMGMPYREIKQKIDEIKAFSGLDNFFEQPVKTYSTGMVARLGFAVAFQTDPDILLIDEVFGVGDKKFREKSSQALKERIRSNKTVVLVSHNANMIMELCDRAVLLEGGCTTSEGVPEKVLDDYDKRTGKNSKTK